MLPPGKRRATEDCPALPRHTARSVCSRPVRPRGSAALVAGPSPCAEPDLFARTKSVHLVVSATMMMMISNSGTTYLGIVSPTSKCHSQIPG